MIVYKDYETYFVLDREINIISDELSHRRNTVAEIDSCYYYMHDEPSNIATAIFAWQEINGRELTNEELRQVMIDNQIISDAI